MWYITAWKNIPGKVLVQTRAISNIIKKQTFIVIWNVTM